MLNVMGIKGLRLAYLAGNFIEVEFIPIIFKKIEPAGLLACIRCLPLSKYMCSCVSVTPTPESRHEHFYFRLWA